MKTIKAWHFLPDNKRLNFADHRKVRVGRWITYQGKQPIELCVRGVHASRSLWDALLYAQGSVICRVELGGKIVEGGDKLVAEKRKVVWWIEGEELLWKFARRCALDVIHLWDVPEVVIKYLETGDESIRAAARDAVWAAARDAARDATRDAAWAAARAATWAAARDAESRAWAAARDAESRAWDAARDAARDAAWAAARAATRAAATEKAKRRLTQMVLAAHRKGDK